MKSEHKYSVFLEMLNDAKGTSKELYLPMACEHIGHMAHYLRGVADTMPDPGTMQDIILKFTELAYTFDDALRCVHRQAEVIRLQDATFDEIAKFGEATLKDMRNKRGSDLE